MSGYGSPPPSAALVLSLAGLACGPAAPPAPTRTMGLGLREAALACAAPDPARVLVCKATGPGRVRFAASACQAVFVAVALDPTGVGEVTHVGPDVEWVDLPRAGEALVVAVRPVGAPPFEVARGQVTGLVGPRECPPGMPNLAPTRHVSPSLATPLVVAGGALRVKILHEASTLSPHASVQLLDADPSAGVPEHTHETSFELLYILDGAGRMRVGSTEIRIEPGVIAYVPPATLHDYRADGTRPLRALQVYAPPGPEQRFRAPPPAAATPTPTSPPTAGTP